MQLKHDLVLVRVIVDSGLDLETGLFFLAALLGRFDNLNQLSLGKAEIVSLVIFATKCICPVTSFLGLWFFGKQIRLISKGIVEAIISGLLHSRGAAEPIEKIGRLSLRRCIEQATHWWLHILAKVQSEQIATKTGIRWLLLWLARIHA